jgi:hypothetical protein
VRTARARFPVNPGSASRNNKARSGRAGGRTGACDSALAKRSAKDALPCMPSHARIGLLSATFFLALNPRHFTILSPSPAPFSGHLEKRKKIWEKRVNCTLRTPGSYLFTSLFALSRRTNRYRQVYSPNFLKYIVLSAIQDTGVPHAHPGYKTVPTADNHDIDI